MRSASSDQDGKCNLTRLHESHLPERQSAKLQRLKARTFISWAMPRKDLLCFPSNRHSPLVTFSSLCVYEDRT